VHLSRQHLHQPALVVVFFGGAEREIALPEDEGVLHVGNGPETCRRTWTAGPQGPQAIAVGGIHKEVPFKEFAAQCEDWRGVLLGFHNLKQTAK